MKAALLILLFFLPSVSPAGNGNGTLRPPHLHLYSGDGGVNLPTSRSDSNAVAPVLIYIEKQYQRDQSHSPLNEYFEFSNKLHDIDLTLIAIDNPDLHFKLYDNLTGEQFDIQTNVNEIERYAPSLNFYLQEALDIDFNW